MDSKIRSLELLNGSIRIYLYTLSLYFDDVIGRDVVTDIPKMLMQPFNTQYGILPISIMQTLLNMKESKVYK